MHTKQIERLVNKMKNLTEIYQKYVVEERTVVSDVSLNGKPVMENEKWGSDFEYGLFSFKVSNINENKNYYLYCETGSTEHLVSVNGNKTGLLDYIEGAGDPSSRIHKYLLLEGIKNGDLIEIEGYYSHPFAGTFPYHKETTFSLNSLNNDRVYKRIELVTFNEELKKLVEDMNMMNELYDISAGAKRVYLVSVYEELFKVLSLKDECPSSLSVKKALGITKDVREKYNETVPYVGIIGHSHLDTAWLWTVEETHHKLLRTVSNAVTLLKKYPEYKFFLSTVAYLEWIKNEDENLYKDVVELIKEGRLETNGASYIEFDSNLIGSEALCRQFLRGQKFLKEEADYTADTFWLPDTFGYAASLPQILKLSGVKYFLTTKLSWNDTNTFPYDTFNWTGIDGSSVPTHFNTIHCWVDPVTVTDRINKVIDKNTTTDVLISYGFGDGGGGPSKEMVERAIDTCKTYKNAKVEHTTVSDFMKKVSEKKLPSYYGELYLELHRGTYTSIHDIKKYHALLEVLLHDYEAYNVLSEKSSKEEIDKYYDLLMLNEFHDILPGTCINEVNTLAIKQLKDSCEEIYRNHFNGSNYFNPTQFEHTERIDGKLYKGAPYGMAEEINSDKVLSYNENSVQHEKYKIKFSNGLISSLVFHNKEYVSSLFGKIRYTENIPFIYDNWDIDADYKLKEKDCEFISAEEQRKNDHEYVISSSWKAMDSVINCVVTIDSDLDYINYEYNLDVKNDHLLIRSYFDTNIFSDHYTSDIQFGNIRRNTRSSSHEDEAKFETCSHKWIDLSNNSYGISLLKKDLYGTSCEGNMLGVTLHKGGTHPDNIHEKGHHECMIGLFPHTNYLSMETVREGYAYNYPLVKAENDINPFFSISESGSVVIETIKEGENGGKVLRLYESLGADSEFTLKLNKPYNISEVNILEEEIYKLGCMDELNLKFRPFEIKTILMK